jgi:hypothetical protein
MITMDVVRVALQGWPQPRLDGDTVVVPTFCLYPSNGIVNVYVDGREREFMVHDRGGAIEELHASVGMEAVPNSFIYGTARRRGVSVARQGSLFVKDVPVESLAAAISAVANASREVAGHLIDYYRLPPRRPLSDEVETILDTRFPSQWRKEEAIIGQSAKRHRFDYIVTMRRQRLLLDLVKPDASSVNAAVVAHLDVEQASPREFVHRVIYDDREKWPSESLALLRVGAIPLALSAANDALARLAA